MITLLQYVLIKCKNVCIYITEQELYRRIVAQMLQSSSDLVSISFLHSERVKNIEKKLRGAELL